MKDKKKYNKITIIYSIILEKVHRYLFDIIYDYNQNNIYTIKGEVIRFIYKYMFMIKPDFRPYLKHNKNILIRAYNLNKLSTLNYCIYKYIVNKNFIRYSSYIN